MSWAAGFADAREFASDVARKLDAAQQIILAIRDALPHKASEVTEVWLTINGRQVFRVRLHPPAG